VKIVVAGATGLVGSSLIRVFQKNGHEVIGLSRDLVDLRNFEETTKILSDISPDVLVDAAAKVGGIGANQEYPVEFLSENLSIQQNLMFASHKARVRKFVFLGSSCIYPRDCPQPIDENYLMSGPLETSNSAYAVAKIAGIELINSFRREYGSTWISLMPTNLYGPGDNFNLDSSHVMPALIRRFVEGSESSARRITLWGTGSPLREFLHVDDLGAAVLIAIEHYDSSLHLNIGTGNEVSIKELAQRVANYAGYSGEIAWDTSKPDGTPRKVLNVSRIKALGWEPTIGLDEGISSTIDWYKKANARGEVRK
jgi:GDP-L-fucose synthase